MEIDRVKLLEDAIAATLKAYLKSTIEKFAPDYDLEAIGQELISMGMDSGTDGFWVLNVVEGKDWYSPKYRKTFGYESEKDYPNYTNHWQTHINQQDGERARYLLGEHIEDPSNKYELEARYEKKGGGEVTVVCEGETIVKKKEAHIIVGTHTVANNPKGFFFSKNSWSYLEDAEGNTIGKHRLVDEDQLSSLAVSLINKRYKSNPQSFPSDMIITVGRGWVKHTFLKTDLETTTLEGESIFIKKNTAIIWEAPEGFLCFTKFMPKLVSVNDIQNATK